MAPNTCSSHNFKNTIILIFNNIIILYSFIHNTFHFYDKITTSVLTDASKSFAFEMTFKINYQCYKNLYQDTCSLITVKHNYLKIVITLLFLYSFHITLYIFYGKITNI